MLKRIIHNTTFTRNVAFPGIIVLVLLSLLSALFPVKVNSLLTFVQSFSPRKRISGVSSAKRWNRLQRVANRVGEIWHTVRYNQRQNGPLSIEISVPHEHIRNFRYGVTAEKRVLSDYLVDEDNTPDADNSSQYIPVTYYSDGRTGNDIQYLSKDEIIADVLREYGRYISSISDDRNAMVFVDKKPL